MRNFLKAAVGCLGMIAGCFSTGEAQDFEGMSFGEAGGKEYNVTGFRILPRAEQGAPGMIKDYKVYVKATGFDY